MGGLYRGGVHLGAPGELGQLHDAGGGFRGRALPAEPGTA